MSTLTKSLMIMLLTSWFILIMLLVCFFTIVSPVSPLQWFSPAIKCSWIWIWMWTWALDVIMYMICSSASQGRVYVVSESLCSCSLLFGECLHRCGTCGLQLNYLCFFVWRRGLCLIFLKLVSAITWTHLMITSTQLLTLFPLFTCWTPLHPSCQSPRCHLIQQCLFV